MTYQSCYKKKWFYIINIINKAVVDRQPLFFRKNRTLNTKRTEMSENRYISVYIDKKFDDK